MFNKREEKSRQAQVICIEDLVPKAILTCPLQQKEIKAYTVSVLKALKPQ